MIYVRLNPGQGLGNQLWNIAAGFSLAQLKKFDFGILNYDLFLGKNIFDLQEYKIDFPKVERTFYEKLFFDDFFNAQIFDFDPSILDVSDNTLIEGNFQSTRYFFEQEESLKKFFKVNNSIYEKSKKYADTHLFNIRGGEYKRHKNLLLPESYWRNAEKKYFIDAQFKKMCVTDDQKYAMRIFPNLEIISGSIEECFAALMGCQKAIISNSSFAFFPLFLNTSIKKVYAPYQWSRFNNKKNFWVSPCNYYSQWNWIDKEGHIISHEFCLKNISDTIQYYKNSKPEQFFTIPKFNLLTKTIKLVKKVIKKTLGIFDWRYE